MKNFIKNIFDKISKYVNDGKDTCRLIEINLSKQEVKFQIKMKLPILTCSISQAIHELNLVSHISATEACYLGGHYGRMISANKLDDNQAISFLMKNSAGRHQILYKDRSGNISYYDRILQKECIESPLSMVSNEKLISQFNSSQACFIGISAGIQFEKISSKHNALAKTDYFSEKRPHLKLVK